ncbi:MAG TPA: endolytic transglycosylase MltG [Gammaproteobacteria bacterium]|nr:endolytic transglycosylase MltG [Gammaproteobacteria bacterium]
MHRYCLRNRIINIAVLLLWFFPLQSYAKSQYITIDSGQSAHEVCSVLTDHQLIFSEFFCRIYFHVTHRAHKIKAGVYFFDETQGWRSVVRDLVQGNEAQFKWVVRPGDDIYDVLGSLKHNSRVITSDEGALLKQLDIDSFEELQGKLYPDTYYFSSGQKGITLMTRAYKRMHATLDELWSARQEDLPITTLDDAITVASMIEMESAKKDEKALIASVIYNRLKVGMPLQIDASVQYGLKKKVPITREDTHVDTPYNTYMHKGLPPGPLCFPGVDSLEAAMHPLKTKYFYYVLNSYGYHTFSKTYQEHLSVIKGVNS